MSYADRPAVDLRPSRRVGAHRRGDDATRVRTTQRWAVAGLAVATAGLLVYVAFLVAMVWMFTSAMDAALGRESLAVDGLGVVRSVAPVLLVGWCTGLATSAVLARGEAIGARTAGLVAGGVGAGAGTLVLALTDLL
jgi:hypothetical protein